ncbi:hypothetical protein EI94DRAFT_1756444, partial [Lactarius quietus]
MSIIDVQKLSLSLDPTTYEISWEVGSKYLSTYKLTYDAEIYAAQQAGARSTNKEEKDKIEQAEDDIISARVAEYLLVELFCQREILTKEPCKCLSKELRSESWEGGDTNDVVFQIGKLYHDKFIRLFQTTTTAYPTPSLHPSCHSFDKLEAMTNEYMHADGKDYRTARRKVLACNGFRCLLTGAFDKTSTKHSTQLHELSRLTGVCHLVACHILSESTMQGIDLTGTSKDVRIMDKRRHAASDMSLLASFGLDELIQSLLAEGGVHRLGNLLSLEPTCHDHFDALDLWFEHTEKPNKYKVCVPADNLAPHLCRSNHLESDSLNHLFVTFSRTDDSQEYPNPQLLGLHAVCAQVAHMSGAAEAFDKVEHDLEDTMVLALDGSSAYLLDHLLTPLEPIPGVA